MRQPLIARLLLALAIVLSGGLALTVAQAAQPIPQPEQNAAPARIAVVHAAPFNATLANTNVTVVASILGQDVLLTNTLKYRDVFPYLTVPAATYTVKVYAGSLSLPIPAATAPVIQKTVTLEPGKDYTAVAVGKNDSGYPLDLLVLDDTTDRPASATGKVRIVHAAPFGSAGATGTGVDVLTDGNQNLGLNNLVYPQNTGFVTLPSGVPYDLKVVATGTTTPAIINLDPFTLSAGDIVTAIAIGGANNYPAEVLFLPFAERAEAQVRLVHAAPFASGAATVTVTLNDRLVTNNLSFRSVTPYFSFQPGLYTAKVYVGTSATGTPAITAPVVLLDGQRLTVVAMGLAANNPTFPLKLRVLNDDQTPAASATARVRVLHAAAIAADVAGTAVDVRAQNGDAVTGLANITYDQLRENAIVPSGVPIDLKVVPAGQPSGTALIDPEPIIFGAGGAFTFIATGGANGQPAGLIVLNDLAVSQTLYLPLLAR